ncbi:MAG: ABC-F type ribosomal protection protein [Erysipelotrichaceae bacterium]|nr:ABC-F type ribosomal protection protein [Erysipelotrichaceae bacterium]
MLYQINKGTFSYGADTVFSNIQFEVRDTEKIAIVGRNGCGKSTLLKVILGDLTLDSGTIHRMNGITIGSLKQEVFHDDQKILKDELMSVFDELIQMQHELDELTQKMADDYSDKIMERYANLQHAFEEKGGYTYQSELMNVLTRFGFDEADLRRPVGTFSGGQRTRLAFVKLLISKPDILLLDEPTNHLDLETIKWLEGYLKRYPKAVVVVSHDRAFLDEMADVVYEIEFEEMTRYTGNYTSFVQQKRINQESLEKTYRNQQKEIERLNALIEKFRYKKNKAAFAQSKIKYLERMDKVELSNNDDKKFKAHFTCARKGGKNVLEVKDLSIGYDVALAEINLKVMQAQRIAIIGKNGHGKSTFVKTLMGLVEPLYGEIMFGHQIDTGYFDQQLIEFNGDRTVLEEVWNENPDMSMTEVRTLLGSFLFSSDDVFKSVSVLSQGEKVRLYLCKLVLKKANLLILDEPTNHLDILGKEALEDALLDYDGTLLFVSHDRYFIRKIATSILKIEDGTATYYPYNYDEYINEVQPVIEPASFKKKSEPKEVKSQIRRKPSPSDMKKMEAKIEAKETELEELRQLRFEPEYYQDSMKMQKLDEQIDDLVNEVSSLMEQWEEMMELMD